MLIRCLPSIVALLLMTCCGEIRGASAGERLPDEALCGPEIVTVGDAWEHVQLEAEAMRDLLDRDDLVRFPQKTAALASHLSFMQNHSIMVWGEARAELLAALAEVLKAVPRWNRLALSSDWHALDAEVLHLDAALKAIAAQFPDEALISTNAAALLLPPAPQTLRIELDHPPAIEPGAETAVRFRLKTLLGECVPPEALLITHTQKLHALVLDSRFVDYHHAHPQPVGKPGEYQFRFTPKSSGPYRLWIDALPTATGREEFPTCDLAPIPDGLRAPKPGDSEMKVTVDGFLCELTFPVLPLKARGDHPFMCRDELEQLPVKSGETSEGQILIRDINGEPIERLQLTMGAYAHIVGFAEDYKTVLHIHPIRRIGGPAELRGIIDFKIRPTMPGNLRLFVQFSVADTLHTAEFTVVVSDR